MMDIYLPVRTKWMVKKLQTATMLVLGIILGVQGSEYLSVLQDEKAREIHRINSLNLLCYVIIMIIIVCTVWLFKHKRVRFLHDFFHESTLAIIYGLIVGAIIRYSGTDTKVTQMVVKPRDPINLTLDSPPDLLWIKFNMAKVLWNVPFKNYHLVVSNESQPTEARSYAYVFKGELFNPETDKKLPENKHFSERATFDPEIFFDFLLPIIVFHAGYSLKKQWFFKNLGAIMIFAILGTIISCFVVGVVLYVAKYLNPIVMDDFAFSDCLYFGAIISATDPVTVLAIFTDLRVDVKLNALVFGESVLNDVVSIVLASLIEQFKKNIQSGFLFAISLALKEFMTIFLLSLLQGSIFGCVTALLTKHTRLNDHPLLESSLFSLMSYASFLLAEVLGLSGIMSVLFCGICQAHYTLYNLSIESRVRTKSLFDMANFIAENFIFAYIGVSMFTFPQHYWSTSFVVMSFVAIILGRALNIYPLSYLINICGSNHIPYEFQHILFFSGLRGAMAFALAIRNTLSVPRRLMLTSTSFVVIVSVIFCGSTIQPMLHYFQIKTNVEEPHDEDDVHPTPTRHRSGSISSQLITPTDDKSIISLNEKMEEIVEKAWLIRKWQHFDNNFMKPLLTHSQPTLMDTLPKKLMPIAYILTSAKQIRDKANMNGRDQKMDNIVTRESNQELDESKMNQNTFFPKKNHSNYTQFNNQHNNSGPSTSPAEIIPKMLTSKYDNSGRNMENISDVQLNGPTSKSISLTPVSMVLNPEPLLKQIK